MAHFTAIYDFNKRRVAIIRLLEEDNTPKVHRENLKAQLKSIDDGIHLVNLNLNQFMKNRRAEEYRRCWLQKIRTDARWSPSKECNKDCCKLKNV